SLVAVTIQCFEAEIAIGRARPQPVFRGKGVRLDGIILREMEREAIAENEVDASIQVQPVEAGAGHGIAARDLEVFRAPIIEDIIVRVEKINPVDEKRFSQV